MTKPIVQVKSLRVSYSDRIILDNINFTVQPGEIFVVLGGSGSGKTTLLNHMIGLYDPIAGEIILDGQDIVQAEGEQRKKILRDIGVMFQSGALFGSFTLLENVRLPLEELTDLPLTAVNMIALNKLKLVGLGKFAHFMPAEISGGMQKRAAIARAMALDPSILFLDEPSAGLDPITSANLDQLILRLAKSLGITFIIVTHELPSIEAIADRVIMLHDGKIIAEGDPKTLRDLTDNEYVRQFFNRRAGEEAEKNEAT
ncbi:MAG: polyamine ABC transporter ATP-binding protein [Gammaproteobacteria bacterium RIFCSPHIGHO2_12_FULL_35_23]|nr:MAG: polyamine ABC transporter ATP-binding protein [Gammaproteobacteria bacterium RIFCSPHIGHO2_12_FULL_35_23]